MLFWLLFCGFWFCCLGWVILLFYFVFWSWERENKHEVGRLERGVGKISMSPHSIAYTHSTFNCSDSSLSKGETWSPILAFLQRQTRNPYPSFLLSQNHWEFTSTKHHRKTKSKQICETEMLHWVLESQRPQQRLIRWHSSGDLGRSQEEKHESEELLYLNVQWCHSLSQEHGHSWCSAVIGRVFRKTKSVRKSPFSYKTMTISEFPEIIFLYSDTEGMETPTHNWLQAENASGKGIYVKPQTPKADICLPSTGRHGNGYCYAILHQSAITLSQLSLNNFQSFNPEEAQGSASGYPEFPNSVWYTYKYALPLLLTCKLSLYVLWILPQSDTNAVCNFWL